MEMEIRLYVCPFKRRVALDILNRIRYRIRKLRPNGIIQGSILTTEFDEIQKFSFISCRFSYRPLHRRQHREHSDTFEDYVGFQRG